MLMTLIYFGRKLYLLKAFAATTRKFKPMVHILLELLNFGFIDLGSPQDLQKGGHPQLCIFEANGFHDRETMCGRG